MVNLAEAKSLISIARESILTYFEDKEIEVSDSLKEQFKGEMGVFVSLYEEDELIGCIGYPEPVMPLWECVKDSARGAAFEDPRFPPLKKEDYDKIRVELSVLTKPKEIEVKDPSEYPHSVDVGKDGLVIRDEFGAGLLLPQVAVEWGWDSEKFLCETCRKAGLSPDCWNNMKRNVYKFQAQVFVEKDGKVVEKLS